MKKNKTTYRIDCTIINDRLHIDVRDDISLLQALISDKNLNLDPYTMSYLISIRRSMLLTAENVEDDVMRITSKSLYRIHDELLNEDKLQEKALKKESKKKAKENKDEPQKEPQMTEINIVEGPLAEEEDDDVEETEEEEDDEEEESSEDEE